MSYIRRQDFKIVLTGKSFPTYSQPSVSDDREYDIQYYNYLVDIIHTQSRELMEYEIVYLYLFESHLLTYSCPQHTHTEIKQRVPYDMYTRTRVRGHKNRVSVPASRVVRHVDDSSSPKLTLVSGGLA